MKRYLLRIMFLIFCTAISAWADSNLNFTGSWDDKDAKDISFSLFLVQTGNRIEGYHTAVVEYTRSHHVDAVLKEEGESPSITGTIRGNKAHVQFRSGYREEATGTATITLQGNKIQWTIISSTPGHYFPEHRTLYRRKEKQK